MISKVLTNNYGEFQEQQVTSGCRRFWTLILTYVKHDVVPMFKFHDLIYKRQTMTKMHGFWEPAAGMPESGARRQIEVRSGVGCGGGGGGGSERRKVVCSNFGQTLGGVRRHKQDRQAHFRF